MILLWFSAFTENRFLVYYHKEKHKNRFSHNSDLIDVFDVIFFESTVSTLKYGWNHAYSLSSPGHLNSLHLPLL